jgi:hypothetical protein
VHGTVVSLKDVAACIGRPFASALVATAASGSVAFGLLEASPPWLRLAIGVTVLAGVYLWMLLCVMNQKALYLDVIRELRPGPAA